MGCSPAKDDEPAVDDTATTAAVAEAADAADADDDGSVRKVARRGDRVTVVLVRRRAGRAARDE